MRSDPNDARERTDEVAIYLTVDEALVLDAFLERGGAADSQCYAIEDQAELRVLWDMNALLETHLDIVNNASYPALLATAREKVRDLPG